MGATGGPAFKTHRTGSRFDNTFAHFGKLTASAVSETRSITNLGPGLSGGLAIPRNLDT